MAMFSLSRVASGLVVTPSIDANALVGLLVGPGITVVPGSASYTGASGASGSFSDGASAGIGIGTGLLMTSGHVQYAVGPNNADGAGVDNGASGSAALTALSGITTRNAAVLDFQFTSNGGDLFFNYVFGSEEYNEYTNTQFNDVFAFFLDGVNIALIPGTATPVSINTVNGGNPLGTAASNAQFFVNNDLQDGGPFFNIQYDGFTKVFTASAIGLAAGPHTISLQIADSGDGILDSGVFIQGGSFSDTPQPPGVPDGGSALALMGLALAGMAGLSRKR